MSTQPFAFKQFSIAQDQCAMKIGTDAVLLGAWTPLKNNPNPILDIGAGTGILALMLAQRSAAATIDAIEIDSLAYEQCVTNFENSSWNDRLFCYHASLEEFTQEIDEKYQLIVSNPPFYTTRYKTTNNPRNTARFNDAMPFNMLLQSVAKLLTKNGTFSTIIPYKEEEKFITLAEKLSLFPSKILHVKGTINTPIKRSLLEFSFQKKNTTYHSLIIEIERAQYTKAYINLTKDFYLKM